MLVSFPECVSEALARITLLLAYVEHSTYAPLLDASRKRLTHRKSCQIASRHCGVLRPCVAESTSSTAKRPKEKGLQVADPKAHRNARMR